MQGAHTNAWDAKRARRSSYQHQWVSARKGTELNHDRQNKQPHPQHIFMTVTAIWMRRTTSNMRSVTQCAAQTTSHIDRVNIGTTSANTKKTIHVWREYDMSYIQNENFVNKTRESLWALPTWAWATVKWLFKSCDIFQFSLCFSPRVFLCLFFSFSFFLCAGIFSQFFVSTFSTMFPSTHICATKLSLVLLPKCEQLDSIVRNRLFAWTTNRLFPSEFANLMLIGTSPPS